MWNGGNHPLYSSSMNNNNDPPPPRPEGTASRSSSIHMDTDQLDAVSALTSLQGGGAFPVAPYFVDPMVAAAAGFYAPPLAFYPTSSSQQHHRDEPPRSILEMSHIYSSSGGPTVASSAPDEEEDSEEEDDEDAPPVSATPIPVAPRGKPESAAARARWLQQPDAAEEEVKTAPPQKKAARSKTASTSPKKKKKPSASASSQPTASSNTASNALVDLALTPAREFLLGETVPRMTDAEYHNLSQLLLQFCKVPLLAEFRRPVSLLHPEVMPLYSKIVTYPVDLGHVCRGVRRRHYQHTRDVRLDVWRVFANCVKYNSHPSNKEAVPSFVSIALHLRDYFNNLWQEYMVPSDPPSSAEATEHLVAYEIHQAAFEKRNKERRKRLENSGVLVLSKTFTTKAAKLLSEFIENGGCVDSLDTTPLFGPNAADLDPEVDLVVKRLGQYQTQLQDMSSAATAVEYTLDTFHKDLTNCYTEHVLEDNPSLRNRFRCRLDRFFWKQAVPLHEANSRGVTQSSIWGNLAATIWARESSKKPYWPALCLGILPPAEQREGWHQAVTERNESRLPEKLRTQLMIAKKRCEQAQKRQSLSYFLVEFLGTHEFIWVRETDIIENFDPNADPNKIHGNVKKSRSTSSVVGSKIYATALQECVWASEEYENVLQDAFENAAAPDTEEDDELNFSFHTLAQSDDEAEAAGNRGYQYESDLMDMSDVEEANYLIAHDGILDTSIAGRKNTKKRSQAVKKQVPSKSAPSKEDASGKKKRSRPAGKKADDGGEDDDDDANVPEAVVVQDERGDQRELERRRKKRMRDHEKSERTEARKKTKRRRSISNEEGDGKLVMQDKQTRAAVIVKAYINRLAKQGDYKSLALSGVLIMPSSSVDSVGLLGLSLAFRAASGFLHMPDATKEELAKLKPWVVIDTETQSTSAERVQQIKKKIELLKKEIESVRNDTKRRKDLVSEYVARREEKELIVEAEDMAARLNHYKKRKRATPTKNDERSDNESPEGKMSVDGAQETVEDEVEDMSKEHSDVETDMDEPMLVATEDSPGVEEQSDEGDSDE